MKDLMTAVKECNFAMRMLEEQYKSEGKSIQDITDPKEQQEITDVLKSFHEQVKDQCDFDMFMSICHQDIKYNLIGGGILSPDKDTTISIGSKDTNPPSDKNSLMEMISTIEEKEGKPMKELLRDPKAKKINRLKDLSMMQKMALKMVKKSLSDVFIKPFKQYDENGLRFPIENLNNPALRQTIIMLPLEDMAEYVDLVTKTHIDNNETQFIRFLTGEPETGPIEEWNVTSIGNMAYVVLHCKNEEAVAIALKNLERFHDYSMEKLGEGLEMLSNLKR